MPSKGFTPDHYVQVWCESRSISGVLEEVCSQFAVNLFPSGGFPSDSFIDEAAEVINESGKLKVTVPYVGDYDDYGLLIDKGDNGLEKKLRERLRPEIKLTFIRIAVTEEQIKKYGLPTKAPKKNNLPDKAKRTVEVETMDAATCRNCCGAKSNDCCPKMLWPSRKKKQNAKHKNWKGSVSTYRTSPKRVRERIYRQSCPFLTVGGLPFPGTAGFVLYVSPCLLSALSGITSTN